MLVHSQMFAMARIKVGQSWELGSQFRFPLCVEGMQLLECFPECALSGNCNDESELDLTYRHSDMGCKCLQQY